jgi:hypothetical protein
MASLIDVSKDVLFQRGIRIGYTDIKGNETEDKEENSSNLCSGLIRYNPTTHRFQGLHHKDGANEFNETWRNFGLDVASKEILGGIKVGSNLNIDLKTGILSAVNTATSKIYRRIITVSPIVNQADYISINEAILNCLGTEECGYINGIFTDSDNYRFLGQLSNECIYTIILSPGIYKEYISLPDNVHLICEGSQSAIIKFPKNSINIPQNNTKINHLITMGNNTVLKNIKIIIDTPIKIDKWIGIFSENKNNIVLDNVSVVDYENLNNQEIIGIYIYGGCNNIIKSSEIIFNLGYGIIKGIVLKETEIIMKNNIIIIDSPSNYNYAIYVENSTHIILQYNNVYVGESVHNVGMFLDSSSVHVSFSSIVVNGNSEGCYGIYCMNDIHNDEYDEDIETITRKEVIYNSKEYILEHNKIKFKGDIEIHKETTFIDLGFQEGDIINVDNTNENYKITKVDEYEITIDLQFDTTDITDELGTPETIQIKINPVYNLELYNSVISTSKSTSTKNHSLYVSNTDTFHIIIKNTSIIGGEPHYNNSYVVYDIPNKIFVSLDAQNGYISKLSTAINILKNRDIKYQQSKSTKGYIIEINEGIYNECETLQLIENMIITGMGIDKTIINFNIESDKQLEYIVGLVSNVQISNLTINFTLSEKSTYTDIDNTFLIYGISESNIEFVNVKFNISTNGLYFKNCSYNLENCQFILDYKNHTNTNTKTNMIYNKYSFGKINNCIFKINSYSTKNHIIYCKNSFLDINKSLFKEQTESKTRINEDNSIGICYENDTNDYMCKINDSCFELENVSIHIDKNVSLIINNCIFNSGEIISLDKNNINCNNSYQLIEQDNSNYTLLNNYGEIDIKYKNTIVGTHNNIQLQESANNTLIGYEAGEKLKNGCNNTFIGLNTGKNITNGENNICIGNNSGIILTNNCNNNTIIGNYDIDIDIDTDITSPNTNNNILIGNSLSDQYYGNGNIILTTNNNTNNNTNNTTINQEENKLIISGSGSGNTNPLLYGDLKDNIIYINKCIEKKETTNNTTKNVDIDTGTGTDIDTDTDTDTDTELYHLDVKLNVNGKIKCEGIMNTTIHKNVILKDLNNIEPIKGMLVAITDKDNYQITNIKNDKKVYGIFNTRTTIEEQAIDFIKLHINNNIILSGECYILSSNINGNIYIGDYISSSDINGYAMKQSNDNKYNYTIAKCIDVIDWDNIYDLIDYNGKKYKKSLIYCKIVM